MGYKFKTKISALCWHYGTPLYDRLSRPIGLVCAAASGTLTETWSTPERLRPVIWLVMSNEINFWLINGECRNFEQWNGNIHPLLNMTIYGAIWYQGESNYGSSLVYTCKINNLVSEWRRLFHEGIKETMDKQTSYFLLDLCSWLLMPDRTDTVPLLDGTKPQTWTMFQANKLLHVSHYIFGRSIK